MDTKQTSYRTSIKGLVLKDDKVLLTQEDNSLWEILGGGMDHGDKDFKQTLRREIYEETGIKVTKIYEQPLFIVRSFIDSHNSEKIDIVYQIELDSLDFTPSNECIDLQFFTIEEARKLDTFPNIPPMLDSLEKYLRG